MLMMKNQSIHIGTSGWHYNHWRGVFYPESLKPKDFLKFYAEHFATAEINNTFYRLPTNEAVSEWRETVPERFIFSVKASRYITHMKKLKEPETSLPRFLEKAELLVDKLGPILFQLPPYWHFDLERLQTFLKSLPSNLKYAFEFRDPTWFDEKADKALKEYNAAFCVYDFAGTQSPRTVTADFVYIRLHGPEGAYSGKYTHHQLSDWANFISDCVKQDAEVFCYFDNDEAGYAVQDALMLKRILKV